MSQYLEDTFKDEALERLTSNFTTPKAQSVILRIASNLPKANLTRFATTSLAKLKQVYSLIFMQMQQALTLLTVQLDENDESTSKYEPLLACLFAWKYEAEVIKLITSWLESTLKQGEQEHKGKSKAKDKRKKKGKAKTRGRRGKKLQESEDEDECSDSEHTEGKPLLALRLLHSILEKDEMRDKLLKRSDLVVGIMEAFESYIGLVQARFSSDALDEELPDEFIFRVIDCHTRFIVHAIGSDNAEAKDKGEEALNNLLTWTTETVLPLLHNSVTEDTDETLADAFVFLDKVQQS